MENWQVITVIRNFLVVTATAKSILASPPSNFNNVWSRNLTSERTNQVRNENGNPTYSMAEVMDYSEQLSLATALSPILCNLNTKTIGLQHEDGTKFLADLAISQMMQCESAPAIISL